MTFLINDAAGNWTANQRWRGQQHGGFSLNTVQFCHELPSLQVGEAPGPINFTQMVTLFAEKMSGGNFHIQ